jgi:hypothetical protein
MHSNAHNKIRSGTIAFLQFPSRRKITQIVVDFFLGIGGRVKR